MIANYDENGAPPTQPYNFTSWVQRGEEHCNIV